MFCQQSIIENMEHSKLPVGKNKSSTFSIWNLGIFGKIREVFISRPKMADVDPQISVDWTEMAGGCSEENIAGSVHVGHFRTHRISGTFWLPLESKKVDPRFEIPKLFSLGGKLSFKIFENFQKIFNLTKLNFWHFSCIW